MATQLDIEAMDRVGTTLDAVRYAMQCAAIGNPLAAEECDGRLVARLQRKLGLSAYQAAQLHEQIKSLGAGKPDRDGAAADARERIQRHSTDFLGVSFLADGAHISSAVGRIASRSGSGRGTGFLIGADLCITNRHVIEVDEEAGDLVLEMDYEHGRDGRIKPSTRFRFDPSIQVHSPTDALDYIVIGVGPRLDGPADLDDFAVCPLSDASDKHAIGEFVNIIQHPCGRPKEVVLRENRLVHRFDRALHYVADTQRGSSGSPVFNAAWQVVALHHWGSPKLEIGGSEERDFRVNEGIRISAIVADLHRQAAGLTGIVQMRLEQALALAGAESVAASPARPAVGSASEAHAVRIPLTLSLTICPTLSGTAARTPALGAGTKPDDLTALKGLGQTRAKALHGAGVTRFDQIAAWDEVEIMRMDARLRCRGAISRDDWPGQARALLDRSSR